jgi:hypothetical protein
MRELGKTKAKPLMQDMGLNSLESALSPKFVPHFRYAEGTPQARQPPCPLICPPLPPLTLLIPCFTGGDA